MHFWNENGPEYPIVDIKFQKKMPFFEKMKKKKKNLFGQNFTRNAKNSILSKKMLKIA